MSEALEAALECFVGRRTTKDDPIRHRFALLPSRQDPRFLFPLGNSRAALQSLRVYTTYAPAERLRKSVLMQVVRSGLGGLAVPSMLVGEPLGIKALVTNVTGERHPVFAIVLGRPGKYRKLAIQVMRPRGETLGYIKVGLSRWADSRVRREARVLEEIARLEPQVPRVLFAGEWQNRYMLFQSALDGPPGPAELSRMHITFLERLAVIRRLYKPGLRIVEEVGARWHEVSWRSDASWQRLGRAVLAAAAGDLERIVVPCGYWHGDFAPWNTCVRDGCLAVFDWEACEDGAPLGWDAFHFSAEVTRMRKEKWRAKFDLAATPGARGLFLLYLLVSLSKALDEGREADLECRRQELMAELAAFS